MREFDVQGLGMALRGRRLIRGLDLRAASKEIGISAATLGRVEGGNDPALQTAVLLCDWLTLPLDSFVRETQDRGRLSGIFDALEKRKAVALPPLPPDVCRASPDGECTWEGCPQLRDGEPEKSGRSCPLRSLEED